jgi:DNA-binding transcriptional LysR family regulator
VALPDDYALRSANAIEWQDLRNEHVIVRKSDRDPARRDRLIRRLTDGNQAPILERLDVSRGTLMHLVALGRGIGLTSEATIATPFPKVVFRPVAGEDAFLQFCAVWSSQNNNPALRRFLSLA